MQGFQLMLKIKSGKSKKFKNNGGLSSYVTHLKGRKQTVSDIFECSATDNDVGVEIAMQWTDSYLSLIHI